MEEFIIKFSFDNKAMSNIQIGNIARGISLIPIEIVMRNQTLDIISDSDFNIIVNLHPADGTHWLLFIRREGGVVFYFDSFGVVTPPVFIEEYVDLGSDDKTQQNDESLWCILFIHDISY